MAWGWFYIFFFFYPLNNSTRLGNWKINTDDFLKSNILNINNEWSPNITTIRNKLSNMVGCAGLLNPNCRTHPGYISWRQERVKLLRACSASPDLRLLIILTGKLGGRTQIRYSRPDKKVELRVAARLTGHCHWGMNVNVMHHQESMYQVS